jgi:hypothetical protein
MPRACLPGESLPPDRGDEPNLPPDPPYTSQPRTMIQPPNKRDPVERVAAYVKEFLVRGILG